MKVSKALLPNCDTCGRFVNPYKPGVSGLFVPSSDVSFEELRYRCAICTQKHGKPIPFQNVVLEKCQFINPNLL